MTLDEIAKRDAASAETWFKPFQGPQQFGAAGRAFVDRRCLLAHIAALRNELTAARLELTLARHDISRLNMRCEAMGWMLYPHSDPAREAIAGDIGWPG